MLDDVSAVLGSQVVERSRTTGTQPATDAQKGDGDEAEKSLVDTITEAGGFQAYVKVLEKEKMEKMREEILKSMGLSEEQLNEMSAEQRGEIEKIVAQEIRERLAASKTVYDGGVAGKGTALLKNAASAPGGQGAGFGVMLAVQEASQRTADEAAENAPSGDKARQKTAL